MNCGSRILKFTDCSSLHYVYNGVPHNVKYIVRDVNTCIALPQYLQPHKTIQHRDNMAQFLHVTMLSRCWCVADTDAALLPQCQPVIFKASCSNTTRHLRSFACDLRQFKTGICRHRRANRHATTMTDLSGYLLSAYLPSAPRLADFMTGDNKPGCHSIAIKL